MGLKKTVAVFVSLLALGIYVPAAGANPLAMTFTEARANVGIQLADAALFEAPNVAPFAAQIDPASGAISNGTLGVPDFATHIEHPIDADVNVDFDIGQISGSFNGATGALSLTGEAGGTLTATNNPTYDGEECTVLAEPSPITLTSSGSSAGANPRTGTPFAAGLSGPGAIAGEWEDMSATPIQPGSSKNVEFCNHVEHQIEGPGGIWLKQEGSLPPSSPPPTPPPPGNGSPPPPAPLTCVVPNLVGKKLGRAAATLRNANCSVGKVSKPKHQKGKRRGALVVKSSAPAAGTTLAAGTAVSLRLGHQHHKPRH